MNAANEDLEPTVVDVLKTKWTLMNYLYKKNSIQHVRKILSLIYGHKLASPYNMMTTKFSKSKSLIAIAGDRSIIEYETSDGETIYHNMLCNIVAHTNQGKYTIFDVIGRGWDDGEWLKLRREAAWPLTLELTPFAADLMDGTRTVCEIPRNMTPSEVYHIVFGYTRRRELE